MRNVMLALKRDLIRLVKAPSALIVMIALLVLPSAYTWYNVAAFWSPYDNTGTMQVSVVNQDAGADSDLTGELNVGDLLVENLAENDQLKWAFEDYDTAMDHLYSGKSYAVFVIPEGFTSNILSITTGDFEKPVINYWVNEKAGPVSPKVTDSGKTVLEETINSTFVKTVSGVVVDAIDGVIDESRDASTEAKEEALAKLGEAVATLQEARATLSSLDYQLSSLQGLQGNALASINSLEKDFNAAGESLEGVSRSASQLQKTIDDTAPAAAQSVSEALAVLSELLPYADAAGYGDQVRAAIASLENYSNILFTQLLPATSTSLGKISAASGALSSVLASNSTILTQARIFVGQLDAVVGDARASLSSTSTLLGDVEEDLKQLRIDLGLLSFASLADALGTDGDLDADAVANFVSNPTMIRTEKLYEPTSYGVAMAPLFMNLTYWIGAFMFLVAFKNIADGEGVKGLTIRQRYMSRFLLFCVPAMIQGIVCSLGLLVMGVSVVSIPALLLASVVCSLAYLSIIYAISLTFMHIGKGICIILVFLQIPSATGLYPIQMTEGFYQALCPFFPFTYGIAAVREALCGFYGMQYFECLGALMFFFALFMVLGLTFQPLMANVNRMAANQINQSALLNGDIGDLPARRFKTAEVIGRLADSEEYGKAVTMRFERFSRMYPQMIRYAIIAMVGVPVVTGVIGAVFHLDRPITLTVWLVTFLLVTVFLASVETFKHNFAHLLNMSDMSDDEVMRVVSEKGEGDNA